MVDAPPAPQPSAKGAAPDAPPSAQDDHLALLRRIQYLLGGLLVLFVLWSISLAKVVILPIVLGVLIALTLSPLVRWLAKRGVPRGIAAVLLIALIGFTSAFGLYMLSGPASRLVETLPQVQAEAETKLASVKDKLRQVREAEEQVQEMTEPDPSPADGPEDVTRVLVDEPGMIETALASLAGTGTALVIALILSMFLLASGDMFQTKLVRAFPKLRDKKRALKISHDIERQISRYLGAITVINAGLGLAVGLTLHGLGMPYAYVWGVAAFLLNYLPYLGAMIGVVAVAAVSVVTYDTLGAMLVPPALYLVLTSIEGQMITPVLVGRHLSLNAAAVFVAVIFWAWLWGAAGALMAVPFLVFVKVVCDNVPGLGFIGLFLGGDDRATSRRRS
ncbi:AI-2E family transporter [Pseudooceanicola nitratireducens]|uniref:AI-2E family transporter n=1 Tax=Pseudooceanicola nitratireducens TaxID=517719 RepID=UPI001FCD1B73|nr:AI-2E family transporter [Pseudooceanicola nitratireducens]